MKLHHVVTACLLGLASLSGCMNDNKKDVSEQRLKSMAGGELKEVVAIGGVVSIDGSPAAGVNLFLYRGGNAGSPIKECRTDEDGKYCWSTYLACDGVEPGTYLVGFTHIPNPKKNGTGVDLFKGKFQDPTKNKFELKVESGSPDDDVNYDLVTK